VTAGQRTDCAVATDARGGTPAGAICVHHFIKETQLDKRQKQIIDAYLRMQRFLATYLAMLPANYAKAKEAFDQVIARLINLSVAQVDGIRQSVGETMRLAALVTDLRDDHLWPLVTTARAHAAEIPGIEKVLVMPDGSLAALYQLAQAKQIRDAARPYAETFVKFGLEPDFMEQLSAAIEKVNAAVGGRAEKVGTHIGARAGIEKELKRGRNAVVALDRYVKKALKGNTEALAEWDAAKRIQALPGGSSESAPESKPAVA
jgi:hypothetical protein